MLGISAFLALSDACAACGPAYPALDAPATPERVLAAVRRARGVTELIRVSGRGDRRVGPARGRAPR